jgi:hypothetical protein
MVMMLNSWAVFEVPGSNPALRPAPNACWKARDGTPMCIRPIRPDDEGADDPLSPVAHA